MHRKENHCTNSSANQFLRIPCKQCAVWCILFNERKYCYLEKIKLHQGCPQSIRGHSSVLRQQHIVKDWSWRRRIWRYLHLCLPPSHQPCCPSIWRGINKGKHLCKWCCAQASGQSLHNEMSNQQTVMKLRSYRTWSYTSICIEKLERLVKEQDFQAVLLSYKQKTCQVECSADGEMRGSVMKDGIIYVGEAEKQNRFESYFPSQISVSIQI